MMHAEITLRVNGEKRALTVDTRTTLLDALRERLCVMSPKKGCDHGQCGACTVLLDGRRVITCLSLAVAQDGADIVTAEGLGDGEALHPVAQAFLAGGTNLVDHLKLGLLRPELLIDVSRLPFDTIDALPGGGVRIGAMVRNSDLAAHLLIRQSYPALAQAVLAGASGQLRNLATTG